MQFDVILMNNVVHKYAINFIHHNFFPKGCLIQDFSHLWLGPFALSTFSLLDKIAVFVLEVEHWDDRVVT